MANRNIRSYLGSARVARWPGMAGAGRVRRRAAAWRTLFPFPSGRLADGFGDTRDAAPSARAPRTQARVGRADGRVVHRGMPPLPSGPLYPLFKRWIPERLFYLVPALMWLLLSLRHRSVTLPSAANPRMEAGGLWGESKTHDLALFGPLARLWLAPFVIVRGGDGPAAAAAAMREAGLAFPVMAKPDRGYQGWGVRRLDGPEELAHYLSRVGPETGVMLQELVDLGGEAGIFYVREPGEPRGRIVSMALTYAPHVVGDGRRTLAELVAADRVLRKCAEIYRARLQGRWHHVVPRGEVVVLTTARSARVGAIYRDATDLVTEALTRRIDAIARDVEGFHFGRFDIRFGSLEGLLRGEDLVILELNGAGGEMLHLWDGRTGLLAAYRDLWRQYRTAFAIGAGNVRRGHRPAGLAAMIRLQRQQERLRRLYPQSN